MDKEEKAFMEEIFTMKAQKKADELGVKFKVVYKMQEYSPILHFRIKNGVGEVSLFVDYICELVVRKYGSEVRFTYPTRL